MCGLRSSAHPASMTSSVVHHYYCGSKGWCDVGRGKDRIAWETNFPSQWFTLCASELSSTIQEIIIIISVVCGSLGSLLLEAIRKSFMI